MSDNETKRRIIVSPSRALSHQGSTLIVPADVNTLLEDALSVIATEIVKFKAKANKGQSLELSEARVLQGYIKALVELSKEARERQDEADLVNMSDEELMSYFEALRKRITDKQEKP